MVKELPALSESEPSTQHGSETRATSRGHIPDRKNRGMGDRVERHYPWVAGLCIAGVWFFRSSTIPPGTKDLLTSFLNVSAIIVGFLVTSASILLSLDGKWIIQRSKEAGAYRMLVGYLVSATRWWMALALLSAVGIAFVPPSPLPNWLKPYVVGSFSLWIFVAATASGAAFRVFKIFTSILTSISKG